MRECYECGEEKYSYMDICCECFVGKPKLFVFGEKSIELKGDAIQVFTKPVSNDFPFARVHPIITDINKREESWGIVGQLYADMTNTKETNEWYIKTNKSDAAMLQRDGERPRNEHYLEIEPPPSKPISRLSEDDQIEAERLYVAMHGCRAMPRGCA